jgi:hypothetical protein
MLKRELYKGEHIWNRSKFVKVPGTNKRRSRPRPANEWKRHQMPELAIVSAELWDAVQNRFRLVGTVNQIAARKGLFSRALTSPYLFSNLLKCGLCGSNLIIASGGGKKPKYVVLDISTGVFARTTCTSGRMNWRNGC